MVSLSTAVDNVAGVADGKAGDLVDSFATNVEEIVLNPRRSFQIVSSDANLV
jgi:hypothetical protein